MKPVRHALLPLVLLPCILAAPRAGLAIGPGTGGLKQAAVRVSAPYVATTGYLFRDNRTVVIPGVGIETGRTFSVWREKAAGEDGDVKRVSASDWRIVGEGARELMVLVLSEELDGQPLVASDIQAELGMKVYVLTGAPTLPGEEPEAAQELSETTIGAVSESRFTVAADPRSARNGAPVLDEKGALLGIISSGTTATRASQLAAGDAGREPGMSLLPLVGLRLGGEVGGPFDGAFVLDFEIGVTLWDRFSTVFRFGLSASGERTTRELAPLDASTGPGVIEQDGAMFRAGLETRYRQLLTGSSAFPMYLDFVVGVQYGLVNWAPTGLALYGEAGCNPAERPCAVQVGIAPDEDVTMHTVGLSVGADLRLGSMSLGYRFLPEATGYNMANSHQILFGVSMF